MHLPDFEVLEPASIEEAVRELDTYKEQGVAILGGGTDYLVDIRPRIIPQHIPRCPGCPSEGGGVRGPKPSAPYVISLSRLSEIRGVEVDGDIIKIGAMTTIRELTLSRVVREHLPALYDGAYNLGSPLVRNRGTMGGNIANARPAADTFVPSIALDATIIAVSAAGTREIPADSFATAPGTTVLEPAELITHIIFPKHGHDTGSSYYKLANRKALEIAVVSVASFIKMSNNVIESSRIALGAVGPTPLLASTAMDFLNGKQPVAETIEETARLAVGDTRSISDHRGSREYRQIQVEVLVRRTLMKAIDRISKTGSDK